MKAIILVISLALISCDSLLLGDEDEIISLEKNLAVPPQLNDGLEVGPMSESGIKAELIETFISNLQSNSRNIHSVLIIKDGKLVLESYFNGWHRNRMQSIRSVSKSVTSALIGIGIDKGFIESENEKVFDFFPACEDLRTSDKDKILLQHLLMMGSGLDWNQTTFPDNDPRNDEHRLGESDDGFRFVLEKKVIQNPGTVFNYNSGNTDLLAGIIYHSSGMFADEFGEKYLFEPLGINHVGWRKNNNGHPNAAFGIHLYPRDFVKIGKLFLDSGVWDNKQIVSKAWIAKSTTFKMQYPFDNKQRYGYQWWIREWDVDGEKITSFQAQGNGGQVLCVIPALRAVVLLTGRNYGGDSILPYNYLNNIILPALK
jgi:CubicO group peptidase (beta-lactamase class C family)